MINLEELQNLRKMLRKEVDGVIQYNILTLLVGELETLSKRANTPISETDIINGIKKLIKSNNETIISIEQQGGNKTKFVTENEFLKEFLPKELSKEELYGILTGIVFSNVGEGMAYLNTNYANQYDRKVASEVIRSIL